MKTNWNYIDVSTLNFNDKKTWELLQRGETAGVFQLESSGMRQLCMELLPDNMEDLIAILALYRPDTMSEIRHFIDRKHGREKIEYLHEDLIPILGETYGCLIYQEQFMEISKVFAGYSDGEADMLRKGLGKKDKELVRAEAEKFYLRAVENGYPEDVCRKLADLFMDKGGYCFNKGHATGYAITAYKTAFLKANYPVEFMSSLLSNQKKEEGQTDYEGIATYIGKCFEMGIKVSNPSLNLSRSRFAPVDGNIAYGLKLIKGVNQQAIDTIFELRPFASFQDFIDRACGHSSVNKTTVISLIKSGAFDFTGQQRQDLLVKYCDYRFENKLDEIKPIQNVNKNHIEKLMNVGLIDEVEALNKEECTKTWNTLRRVEHFKHWKENYMSGNEFNWEYDTISYHLLGDPFEGLKFGNIQELKDKETLVVGGTVIAIKKTKIKKGRSVGQEMAFIQLNTSQGTIELTAFSDKWSKFQSILEKGSMVVIKGEKNGDGLLLLGAMPLEKYKLQFE